jgi:hypothetical protein
MLGTGRKFVNTAIEQMRNKWTHNPEASVMWNAQAQEVRDALETLESHVVPSILFVLCLKNRSQQSARSASLPFCALHAFAVQYESYMTDWDLLDYCGLQLPKHAESLRTVQNGQRRIAVLTNLRPVPSILFVLCLKNRSQQSARSASLPFC